MSKKSKKYKGRCCENCLYFIPANVGKEGKLPCFIGGIPQKDTALKNDIPYCYAFIWSNKQTMF